MRARWGMTCRAFLWLFLLHNMLPLSMTLQRVAVWGLLGLGMWAGAAPVKVVDDKAGITRITDKATGETILLKDRILSYSRNSRRIWSMPSHTTKDDKDSLKFIDALLVKDGIIASANSEGNWLLVKFSKQGKQIWQVSRSFAESVQLDAYWPMHDIISFNEDYSGPAYFNSGFALNSKDGKLVNINRGYIKAESKQYLAIDDFFIENVGVDDFVFRAKKRQQAIKQVTIHRFEPTSAQFTGEFKTPPRKACGDYRPGIAELSYTDNDKQAALYTYYAIKGDYIYAHRADGCGKFTYKFHWTDPKNPAPQILQGWK